MLCQRSHDISPAALDLCNAAQATTSDKCYYELHISVTVPNKPRQLRLHVIAIPCFRADSVLPRKQEANFHKQ